MSFIKNLFVRKSDDRIKQLLSKGIMGDNTQLRSRIISSEQRKGSTVQSSQLETLYRFDSLTFRIVHKYIEKILGHSYVIDGDDPLACDICSAFAKDINLINLLSGVIFDIFVTGNGTAWVELGYTDSGDDIVTVTLINPKSGIDFIRDSQGNIMYDSDFKPVGYKIDQLGYPKVEWRNDRIIQDGEIVWSSDTEDGRDRIAYFKLINIGDELGMSPLEPSYKSALIRLNLEDIVGNSIYRSASIIGVIGSDNEDPRSITDEQLNSLKKELLDVDQFNVWVFRNNVNIKTFPTPSVNDLERMLYYFADLQSSGSGVNISLILQPLERGYRGDIEVAREEFNDTISLYQQILSFQIREYLFKRLLKARGINPNKAPNIIFKSRESGIALSTARRLSTYARYGLITPSPELEKWIRLQEGLPLN